MPATDEIVIMTEHKRKSNIMGLYERYWYVLDIMLVGFVLLFRIFENSLILISYICGIYNSMGMLFKAILLFGSLLFPAFLCLLILPLRMIISWPEHIQDKRKLLSLCVLVIIVVTVIVYLGAPFKRIGPSGGKAYAYGLKKHMEARADIEAIRGWLSTLSPKDCTGEEIKVYVEEKGSYKLKWPEKIDWHDSITCFEPRYVNLSLDNNNHPMICLTWRGYHTRYGIVVDGQGMDIPASDFSGDIDKYRLELCKGAYVWFDAY